MAFANFIMLLKNMGLGLMENFQGLYSDSSGGPAFKAEWCQLKFDGFLWSLWYLPTQDAV